MGYDLKSGARIDRVSEAQTTRDNKGADVTVNTGDVIITGTDGSVAVVPAAVFDAVFEENENPSPEPAPEPSDNPTPEPSPSPDAPDAPTGGPATA